MPAPRNAARCGGRGSAAPSSRLPGAPKGTCLYLKHQRRSGVPSVPFPTVTISPERKAFRRNTGKERSMSRMVVAHCRGHQGPLSHSGTAARGSLAQVVLL